MWKGERNTREGEVRALAGRALPALPLPAATTLLGPGIQYARLLYASLHVPSWGAAYMQRSWLAIKLMQLGAALPLTVLLLQVGACASWAGSVRC